MAALSPADAVLSVGQRIGRYFALTSMIPSLLLTLWVYIIIASGVPSASPSLRNVETALSHWSAGKVIGIVVASLAVSLVLHPLQFIMTQLLEGYWGTSPLGVQAMTIRIVHHRNRRRDLLVKAETHKNACRLFYGDLRGEKIKGNPKLKDDPADLARQVGRVVRSRRGDQIISDLIAEQEARSQADKYPSDARRILPTRLGNALRRFEDAAGSQYGLRALVVAPHLHLVAPMHHREYLIDARQALDSSIRICVVALIAAVLTVGFLLTHGLWILWALLPYSVSYLSYRGAVSAAHGYGIVVASAIDLDRFRLYQALGLGLPQNTMEERSSNIQLMRMLTGERAYLRYFHQEDPAAAGPVLAGGSDSGDQG